MKTSVEINYGEDEIIAKDLAKLHLRVDEDYIEEDPLIELAIGSARMEVENYIQRKLLKGTMVVNLSMFSDFSEKLISDNDMISKVEYYDVDGELKVLPKEYYSSVRTYLYLNVSFSKELPEVAEREDAVIVTVSFGYDSEDCPKDIMSAMLLQVAESYDKRENRTALHQSAVRNLLDPYRKWQ